MERVPIWLIPPYARKRPIVCDVPTCAPRVGSDPDAPGHTREREFQSALPVWGATAAVCAFLRRRESEEFSANLDGIPDSGTKVIRVCLSKNDKCRSDGCREPAGRLPTAWGSRRMTRRFVSHVGSSGIRRQAFHQCRSLVWLRGGPLCAANSSRDGKSADCRFLDQ